jgi:hypothetical protein
MTQDADRVATITAIEISAKLLSEHQVDLLSQFEAQMAATVHTLSAINRLRDVVHRVGPEPSNGERFDILRELSKEITDIATGLHTQEQTCLDQQQLIRTMRAQLHGLKVRLPPVEGDR